MITNCIIAYKPHIRRIIFATMILTNTYVFANDLNNQSLTLKKSIWSFDSKTDYIGWHPLKMCVVQSTKSWTACAAQMNMEIARVRNRIIFEHNTGLILSLSACLRLARKTLQERNVGVYAIASCALCRLTQRVYFLFVRCLWLYMGIDESLMALLGLSR